MKKLRNHLLGIDQGSVVMFSDFENDGKMWAGTGPRMTRKKVKFSEAYRTVPSVHVSMSMWHCCVEFRVQVPRRAHSEN